MTNYVCFLNSVMPQVLSIENVDFSSVFFCLFFYFHTQEIELVKNK